MVKNRDKELQTLTKPNCPSRSTAQAHDISDSVLQLLYFWSLCIFKQKGCITRGKFESWLPVFVLYLYLYLPYIFKQKGCITRGKLESWLPPPAKLDDWESCHRAVSQALDHTAVSQYHSITVSQVGKVATKQYHKR